MSFTKAFLCDICSIVQTQYDLEEVYATVSIFFYFSEKKNKDGFAPADILDQQKPVTEQPGGLPGIEGQLNKAATDAARMLTLTW